MNKLLYFTLSLFSPVIFSATITLTWNHATDTATAPLTAYRLYQTTQENQWPTRYTLVAVKPGTEQRTRVTKPTTTTWYRLTAMSRTANATYETLPTNSIQFRFPEFAPAPVLDCD